MQDTIKQNRTMWMVLKQENKQYKQQLMQRRDSVTQTTAAEEQVCVCGKQRAESLQTCA